MRDIWQLLQQARAEIVISGHDHVYERFVPLDANRRPTPDGLRNSPSAPAVRSSTPS